MTSHDPEIRAEVSKLRVSEKEARILDAAFEKGGSHLSPVSVGMAAGFEIMPGEMPGNVDG